MSRARILQTNFTAGELAPRLYGRGDLRAYENGAARLRNVFIHPTGGLSRRDGLYFVDSLPGAARLVPFEFNTEQTYLLAFTHLEMRVYRAAALLLTLPAPWTGDQLGQLVWTQSADTLLVCHPDVPPRAITRAGERDWRIGPWPMVLEHRFVRRDPFYRFAPPEVSLTPSGTAALITITADGAVFTADGAVFTADGAVFTAAHVGVTLRIKGKQVDIVTVDSPFQVTGSCREVLLDTQATLDWDELAWSAVHGWPVSATFHQDRLVVGGSRDLPNRLWLSKSGELFNFDLGKGLEDEAIEFPILSDQVNAIRHVFSGRHLQVFTSGAEWMVTGDPLTPEAVQLHRQTRIGSPVDRSPPPRDVEGATLFIARNDRELREFLFTDAEQAYRAADLALLANHLVIRPMDQDYDQRRRLLFVVMADGTLGTLTAYRSEQVTAWTLQETDGRFGAVAVSGDTVYVTVQRANGWSIEMLSDTVMLDAALTGSAAAPKTTWTGLGHLEGRSVRVVADGVDRGPHTVSGGAVTLAQPARQVTAGLPYTHIVQPLPPFLIGDGGGTQGMAMRPVQTIFRLHETQAFVLDTGRGPAPVPLRWIGEGTTFDQPPPPFTGDRRVRQTGWTRSATTPFWHIEQDTPLPFSLLSVTTELMVNN